MSVSSIWGQVHKSYSFIELDVMQSMQGYITNNFKFSYITFNYAD